MTQGNQVLVRASAERKAVRSPARCSPIVRSRHRLVDLKAHRPVSARLMNGTIPAEVASAIDTIAAHVHASKTEVVIALLNEGLYADSVLRRWHPALDGVEVRS